VPDDFYSVFVEKEGFAILSHTMIQLNKPMVFTLNAGGVKEPVSVSGGAIPPPPPPPPPPPFTAIPDGANRVRIGGNVQATKLVNRVAPIYPADCKAEGIEGVVLLQAVIGKVGEVLSLEPVNQFVDSRLRDAAVSAVKMWRYQPTLLNGNPVEVTTQVEVNFTLAK
jgi:protein TonB